MLYPGEPGGSITVDNHITINIQSLDFAQLNQKIGELLNHLDRSKQWSTTKTPIKSAKNVIPSNELNTNTPEQSDRCHMDPSFLPSSLRTRLLSGRRSKACDRQVTQQ